MLRITEGSIPTVLPLTNVERKNINKKKLKRAQFENEIFNPRARAVKFNNFGIEL